LTDRSEPTPPSDAESGPTRFAALVDAPLTALGLSSSDADALQETLGVRTVRDLANNKYVRRAQAIVHLAQAKE
jgi:hypothetical protein